MMPDGELLRLYARLRSEDAFAELVQRHVNLIYSAALRQVNGDAQMAQDVAQTVFSELARNAATLSRRPVLTGWLYTCAHFAAVKAVRAEARRRHRELQACAMNELLQQASPDPEWEKLRMVLDEVMQELGERDRELILMRYFENRRLGEIGVALGIKEDTARKRVERALDRLRHLVVKRGCDGAASLAAVISANAVQITPPSIAASVTTASGAAAATASNSLLAQMAASSVSKLQLTFAGAVCAAAILLPLFLEHRALASLRDENAALARQIVQLESTSKDKQIADPLGSTIPSLAGRDLSELLRLRDQAGRQRDQLKKLRAKLAVAEASAGARASALSNYFPKESWASAGYATPATAVQSRQWALGQALARRDTNALQKFSPPGWARMVKDSDADEGKIMLALGIEAKGFESTDGFRIINQQFGSNDTVTVTYMTFANGGTNDGWGQMSLVRDGNQWRPL